MRDKEAIDGERKILARDLERQAKVLEKFMAAEKNLRDQLVRRFFPSCPGAAADTLSEHT